MKLIRHPWLIPRSLSARKKKCALALLSPIPSEISPDFRVRPFLGSSDPSKPRRSESLNTAAISREGHHTTRESPTELWFPYAPITDPSTGHVLSLASLILPPSFAPPRTTPSFGLPSQTISVGHFWPLIDVDLFVGLARTRGETWARCVRVYSVDSGEI